MKGTKAENIVAEDQTADKGTLSERATLLSDCAPTLASSSFAQSKSNLTVPPVNSSGVGVEKDDDGDDKDDEEERNDRDGNLAEDFRRSIRAGDLRGLCTEREMAFLESLAEEGDERDMALAQQKLEDKGVFFSGDESSEGGDVGETPRTANRSTVKREKYLTDRQKAQLHSILWKVHDDKVASAAKSRWRRGVRRIVALKGLTAIPSYQSKSASLVEGGDKNRDESVAEETREKEDRRSAIFDRSGLMVRKASIYKYGGSGFDLDVGEGFEVGVADKLAQTSKMPSDTLSPKATHHNAWDVLKKCESNDRGEDEPPPFLILGTSASDAACHPHVLSPPLMQALRSNFPFALTEDNFWLKYSLVRDGSCLYSLLQNVRASQHTVIAVETVEGEVFGSFTSKPWRRQHGYFGNGQSFLWRMRQPRTTFCSSIDEQAKLESDIEVFKWKGVDDVVQLCSCDRIAVGGGGDASKEGSGFGFMIEDDLLRGSSGSCATFGNPCLCPRSCEGGSVFEIANLEVWTMTPFMFAKDAEKNEMMRLFLEENQKTKF